jgi:hypothetical protein
LFSGRGKPDGLKSARLSAEAKLRLKVSGCCRRAERGGGNGTAERVADLPPFGINRPKFYYREKRFDKHNLRSLENRPTVPLKRNRT